MIDEKSQNSQPMKYKIFDDWINQSEYDHLSSVTTNLMFDAWNACVNNYLDDPIGEKITELLNTITDAEKIDCTCDKYQLRVGYRCGCNRGMATQQAGRELGVYLKKLRKGLK